MLFLKILFYAALIMYSLNSYTNAENLSANHNGYLNESSMSLTKRTEQGVVSGQVMHQSDVMTIRNSPYTSGVVLAIPLYRMGSLMKKVERNPGLNANQFSMAEEAFSTHVVASIELGTNGWYSLALSPGDYSLCVGNLGESRSNPGLPPVYIYGCFKLKIKAGDKQSINISYGLGGVFFKSN